MPKTIIEAKWNATSAQSNKTSLSFENKGLEIDQIRHRMYKIANKATKLLCQCKPAERMASARAAQQIRDLAKSILKDVLNLRFISSYYTFETIKITHNQMILFNVLIINALIKQFTAAICHTM